MGRVWGLNMKWPYDEWPPGGSGTWGSPVPEQFAIGPTFPNNARVPASSLRPLPSKWRRGTKGFRLMRK